MSSTKVIFKYTSNYGKVPCQVTYCEDGITLKIDSELPGSRLTVTQACPDAYRDKGGVFAYFERETREVYPTVMRDTKILVEVYIAGADGELVFLYERLLPISEFALIDMSFLCTPKFTNYALALMPFDRMLARMYSDKLGDAVDKPFGL